MENWDTIHYLILFLGIFFSGVIDSSVGGGGLISVPTYYFLGLPAPSIIATNKAVSTIGATLAIKRYVKKFNGNWKIVFQFSIFSMIGGGIGSSLSQYINLEIIKILLILISVFVVYRNFKGENPSKGPIELSVALMCLIIFVIGFYNGIFGPGGGTFLVLALTYLFSLNITDSCIYGRFIIYLSNVVSFSYFLTTGMILWNVVISAQIASFLGNYVGSQMVLSGKTNLIRLILNLVLILLVITLSAQLYF